MHNLEFLHFDTTGQWNATFQQLFNRSNDHPFSLTFNLPTQINNIKKIYLKSIELPVGFTNIRSENNSNTLTISVNGIICTIYITPQNYTITTLINAINQAIIDTNIFIDTNSIYLPTFSIIGQKIAISTTNSLLSTFVSIIFPVDTTLSSVILGFPYNYQIPLTNQITSPSNYNIAYDTYLVMHFPYINHKSGSINNHQLSFKLPYNGSSNALFYSAENTQFSQYIECSEENCVLGSLKFVIYDKLGYIINNNGLDWSFTLGFERNLNHHHHHDQIMWNPPDEDIFKSF